jgi:antitoxin YefM
MKVMTYSYARQHLAETMEKVCADHDPVTITSKRDKAVVVMALDDYETLQETSYLLRSPKNARRLAASIRQIESGKGKRIKL